MENSIEPNSVEGKDLFRKIDGVKEDPLPLDNLPSSPLPHISKLEPTKDSIEKSQEGIKPRSFAH